MRKLKLFLSLLMLMAFSLGNVWGAGPDVTYDFTGSDWSVSGSELTNGTVSFTGAAGGSKGSFKMNSGYLMLGKKGAYLNFPTYSSAVKQIVVTGRSGASGSTKMNIYVGNTAVSTETTGSTGENSYDIATASQTAGTTYTLNVTSDHNAQITKIEIYYAEAAPSCTKTVSVTKVTPTNGDFSISATEVCGDGDGGEVTISDIEPATGYALDEVSVTVGTYDKNTGKVTGITNDTEISVTFKELQKYTVSFNTGAGNPAVSPITEATAGAGITLPDGPTPACSADGWTFAGWAAAAVASETTTAPTLLSGKYNPTDNVTLYAVYKRTEEGGGSETKYVGAELNSLTGSDVFVIVGNNGKNYAMTNDNGTSSAPGASEITITAGEITSEVADNFKWNISGNSTDGYTFYPNGDNTKWLYATNANNGVRVGTNENKAFEIKDAYLYNTGMTRYVGVYNSADWRCYTSINSNIENQTFAFYKATEVTASTTYYLSAPSCAPTVNIDPATVAYGDQKQHYAVDAKTFKLTATNLTSGLTLTASTGYTVAPTSLTEEQAMVEGGVTVTITPVTPTAAGANNGTVTISGGGLEENVIVNLTMNVTPTFEVEVAVNDEKMGTATINGEASVYADENDLLNLVASPNTGYEFVNWTYDNEKAVLDDPNAVSTTVIISEGVTITANFQAQACTNLAAPTLDEVNTQVTYEYANLAWTAVANAETYAFVVTKHGESTPHVSSSTGNTSTMILNLDANTQYDYSVMAKGDGSTYCDENNALLEGSFTTAGYPAATLTLSENGVERAFAGDHKLKDVVTLPTEVETGVVGKVFVGWSSVEIAETDIKPAYLEPGAEFTFNATSNKLYAVYATETPGEATNHDVFAATMTSTVTDGYTISAAADKKDGYYQDGSGDTRYVQVMVTETATQIIPSEPSAITVKATIGGGSAKDPLDNSVYAQFLDAEGKVLGDPVVVTTKVETNTGKEYVVSMPVANYANVRGVRISHVKESGYNVRYYAISLAYTTAAASTYSSYITNGPRLLAEPTISLAAGTYTTAQNVELTAAEGDIYYTLDGTEPTSESDKYTAAIELNKYGEYTLKAIAIDGDNKSNVVSAEYSMKVPFATVDELISYVETNSLTSLTNVTVTGIISQIDNIYSSAITYWISDDGQTNAFEVYRGKGLNGANFDAITDLTVGDQVTVNGNYTYFEPTEGDPIHEFAQFTSKIVERTAAEVTSVVISGEATKTEYFYNEKFLFGGLTAKAIYNTGYEKDVTSEEGLVWAATPEQVTATGNVNVTATYGGKTSDAKVVAVTKQLRELTDEQLAWSAAEAKAYTVGNAYTLPTLTNTLGLAVTYSSETPATATISNEEDHEGEISIVAAGSTVIKAAFAGNDEYAAKEVSYTLTVVAPASVVITGEASNTAYEYGYKFSFEGLGAKAVYTNEDEYEIPAAEITWAATPATVAMDNNVSVKATWEGIESAAKLVAVTVKKHKVTIVQPDHGTLVVKYRKDETPVTTGAELVLGTELIFEIIPETNYKAGKVLVNKVPIEEMEGVIGKMDYEFSAQIFEKEEAGIAWKDAEDGTKAYEGYMQVQGDKIVVSDLPVLDNPNKLTIAYRIEDTNVAEIDPATGVITPKAEGATTISAIFAGDNDYLSDSVSYVLTVAIDQLKFYVVGSFNGWSEFVPVYTNYYELKDLAADNNYQLKVTTAPNWDDLSQVYGYDSLTIKYSGLSKDNNGNICFTTSNEPQTIQILFNKEESGTLFFTVVGDYVKPTFTVVGVEALVGYNWGAGLNEPDNEMVEDPETGNYILEKENVTLAAGDYEYQVAMNHDWRGVSNSTLKISESGRYNITFTYVPSTGATSAEALLIEPIEVLPTMKIAGDWDKADENKWNENALIVAGDEKTASYTATNLVSGTWYHFWIIKNGVYMSGKNEFSRENLSKDLTTYYTGEGVSAMYFQADKDGDYTFTWTYETNVITMTFPYKEATALDNTEAGETAVKVMKNGQLMIMKNGKTYNAQGQIIK